MSVQSHTPDHVHLQLPSRPPDRYRDQTTSRSITAALGRRGVCAHRTERSIPRQSSTSHESAPPAAPAGRSRLMLPVTSRDGSRRHWQPAIERQPAICQCGLTLASAAGPLSRSPNSGDSATSASAPLAATRPGRVRRQRDRKRACWRTMEDRGKALVRHRRQAPRRQRHRPVLAHGGIHREAARQHPAPAARSPRLEPPAPRSSSRQPASRRRRVGVLLQIYAQLHRRAGRGRQQAHHRRSRPPGRRAEPHRHRRRRQRAAA